MTFPWASVVSFKVTRDGEHAKQLSIIIILLIINNNQLEVLTDLSSLGGFGFNWTTSRLLLQCSDLQPETINYVTRAPVCWKINQSRN